MHPDDGRRANLPFQNNRMASSSLIYACILSLVYIFFSLCSASLLHAQQALPEKPAVEGSVSSPTAPEQPSSPPGMEETPVRQDGEKAEQPPSADQGTTAASPPPTDKKTEQPQVEETTIADTIHTGISRSVLTTASWLDSFFYDPRYAAEENRTQLFVRYEAFREQGIHTLYFPRVQFKLRFPQFQNKAHLIISGDPEDVGEETTTGSAEVLPVRTDVTNELSTKNRPSTALAYSFKADERRNYNARFGLRYRHGKVVSFFRAHYRVLYPIGNWSLRFTQEFPWWSDTKWESFTDVDLERQFQNKLFFRTSLIGHWYDNQHGYFYTLSAALVQPLSIHRALSYEWTNNFATRPTNKLNEVVLAVRYRQRIWRDWLYAEIAPQLRYPRDHDFKHLTGIWYRLEMQFGWPFKK